jgi:parallel beta-helix repeat protein
MKRLPILRAVGVLALTVASCSVAAPAIAGPVHKAGTTAAGTRSVRSSRSHHAMTLFVSPSGSSSNAGRSCNGASYSTIQSAVTAAAPWSTIIVCAGSYPEDVAIAEPLKLLGEDAVINASGLNNGLLISASHVTVEGFAVRGATGEGILAMGAIDPALVPAGAPAGSTTGIPITDVTIMHDIVQGNDRGTPSSSYTECQASGGEPGDCGEGIHLMSVADSKVSKNYVTGNSGGILLTDEFGPTMATRSTITSYPTMPPTAASRCPPTTASQLTRRRSRPRRRSPASTTTRSATTRS